MFLYRLEGRKRRRASSCISGKFSRQAQLSYCRYLANGFPIDIFATLRGRCAGPGTFMSCSGAFMNAFYEAPPKIISDSAIAADRILLNR